jgi:hypothetical protein
MSVTEMKIKSKVFPWCETEVRISFDEVTEVKGTADKAMVSFASGAARLQTYATHDELLELSHMALLAAQWLKEQA